MRFKFNHITITRQSKIADFAPATQLSAKVTKQQHWLVVSLQNECVCCRRPLANEIKLRWKNLFCPLVSHFEYMPSWPRTTLPIMDEHDVIHKTRSTQHIALASEEDWAMVRGNTYRKFCEVWMCHFWEMQLNRQTYRHAHHNTLHPYQGQSNKGNNMETV